MSQMVGAQATANVLSGQRYQTVSKEVKSYLRGEYGRAPGEVDPALQRQVLGEEQPITCRYADLLEPGLPAAREHLGPLAARDEDVLSYVAFPQQAEAFFKRREQKKRRTLPYAVAPVDSKEV